MKPFVRDIAREVAQEYGVPLERLLGRERHRNLTRLRIEAFRRALAAGRSSKEIGRVFNRDGSTIRCAMRGRG